MLRNKFYSFIKQSVNHSIRVKYFGKKCLLINQKMSKSCEYKYFRKWISKNELNKRLEKKITLVPVRLFLKILRSRFWENQKKKKKIFHVNVHFRCSDFNQKLAVLFLAYIELRFEFRSSETYGCKTQGVHSYVRKHQLPFFYFSQNLVILLVASRYLKFQISSLCDFPKTRYERLKYLFYDTPSLHPLPLFQSD